MELHQLRYVLAVARAGSFSQAAEELFLSQPSLSVQVRKLEKELDVMLFERLGRRVILTAAGEVFVDHVESGLAHLDQAKEKAAAVRGLQAGRVSLGVLPSVGAGLLPRVLATFREKHPGVEVRLTEHNVSSEFERMVEAGQLDFAVIRNPWTRQGLAGQVLLKEPFAALLPPQHELADHTRLTLSALASENFVAMRRDYGLRELMEQVCLRCGFEPTVTVETTQLSVLHGMVASGLGVSVLPDLAVAGYAPSVRLSDAGLSRELGVVWRARNGLSPSAAALLDVLVEAAATASGSGDVAPRNTAH